MCVSYVVYYRTPGRVKKKKWEFLAFLQNAFLVVHVIRRAAFVQFLFLFLFDTLSVNNWLPLWNTNDERKLIA